MVRERVVEEAFIQLVSERLRRSGLRIPALLLLEAGQPLALFAGQLFWLAQPALSLIWEGSQTGQLAQLLETPAALNRLIALLEGTDE